MRTLGIGIGFAALCTLGLLASCSDETSGTNPPAGKDAGGAGSAGSPGGSDAGPGGAGAEAGAPGDGGPGTTSEALGGDMTRPSGLAADTPLSGVAALSMKDGSDVPSAVKALADKYVKGQLGANEFPLKTGSLATATSDRLRALQGGRTHLVAKWLDALANDPNGPRFGANADYVAYFGEGWDRVAGDPPQWNGSGAVGWLWVNHEYVSGNAPAAAVVSDAGVAGTAPTNQNLWLAQWMKGTGALVIDNPAQGALWTQGLLDAFVVQSRRELGGTWMKISFDAASGAWTIDKAAANRRYDSTAATLAKITGTALLAADGDEGGGALPAGVGVGITADCSGAVTPWGTILSGEENVSFNWGDLEQCWASDNTFRPGKGCDPGADIAPSQAPSVVGGFFNKHSDAARRHTPEFYNYLAEVDVGQAPGEYYGKTTAGLGHRKLGSLGRARWENATFAVDASWKLVSGQPIVMYAADDRVSGRIYKWVSDANYTAGMTKAQARALMDAGKTYVAHFAGLDNRDGFKMLAGDGGAGAPPTQANPGAGRWIWLSTQNTTDDAPNATAVGATGAAAKVGAVLLNQSYNRMGGFPDDDAVRRALFTASNKIGVMELNRPEDVEWNPKSPLGGAQLFVAFTKHTAKVALDQRGLVYDPAPDAGVSAPSRADRVGAIFAVEETNPGNPGASGTFKFFQVWGGSTTARNDFTVANPDNLVVDKNGGVWFGTDGNFETNGVSDGVFYLDLAADHKAGAQGVVQEGFGKAFRVLAMPADAEATGPAFSSDMKTLFVSVQHPGEGAASSAWPFR